MTSFPLAAVIGHPIGHSKSPRIHRHWLSEHGITGDYTALDVEPQDLEAALRALPRLGFQGANLTIPHKVAGLELADFVTPAAKAIGAANTLVFDGDRILADNTDGYGFVENLLQGAPDWQPEAAPAAVLGAGGATRAVLHALLDRGVPEIRLLNRTESRAAALADFFGAKVEVLPWDQRAEALGGAGLLVNATSLGMTGQPPLDLDLTDLPQSALVTDIVYSPLETPLLGNARAKGCAVVDGLGMLLHQAVPGFEAWFGPRPKVTPQLRELVLQ